MAQIQLAAALPPLSLGHRLNSVYAWRIRKRDTEHPNKLNYETGLDGAFQQDAKLDNQARTNNRVKTRKYQSKCKHAIIFELKHVVGSERHFPVRHSSHAVSGPHEQQDRVWKNRD
jgi:hypothetical protein